MKWSALIKIIKTILSFQKKRPVVASTPFSEFIRNASSAEKKKVYTVVLQKATESQQAIAAHKENHPVQFF